MYKLIVFILFCSLSVSAQTKKPAAPKNAKKPVKDTVAAVIDTVDKREQEILARNEFAVYTKRAKSRTENRLKLCINLVGDTTLNYCVNDSLCRDPETSRVLFQQKNGDSTYVLVYVDAFSKPEDKPACDAGHETKLFFVRWNTKTNKAVWKQRSISSCMRAITNMTKEPIDSWDKASPLIFKYHRGGSNFIELKFDPQQYLLGLQTSGDASENK